MGVDGVQPAGRQLSFSQGSDTTQIATMADRMWGGVPFTIPSSTAMKYLSGAVKVKRESALAPGGRYNARQTMEREIVGHRFARQDMNDSYENYAKQKMRARTEPKLEPWTEGDICLDMLAEGRCESLLLVAVVSNQLRLSRKCVKFTCVTFDICKIKM